MHFRLLRQAQSVFVIDLKQPDNNRLESDWPSASLQANGCVIRDYEGKRNPLILLYDYVDKIMGVSAREPGNGKEKRRKENMPNQERLDARPSRLSASDGGQVADKHPVLFTTLLSGFPWQRQVVSWGLPPRLCPRSSAGERVSQHSQLRPVIHGFSRLAF